MGFKVLKYLLLSAVAMSCFSSVRSQEPYPAKWRYNLKRDATGQYQLVFHLELERGWHIRANNVNNDTLMMTPVFSFTPNDQLELKGDIRPQGIMETVKVDSAGTFEVYSYKVLYTQGLAAAPGTKVSGRYKYQVCNSSRCLAPKTEKFAFIMK